MLADVVDPIDGVLRICACPANVESECVAYPSSGPRRACSAVCSGEEARRNLGEAAAAICSRKAPGTLRPRRRAPLPARRRHPRQAPRRSSRLVERSSSASALVAGSVALLMSQVLSVAIPDPPGFKPVGCACPGWRGAALAPMYLPRLPSGSPAALRTTHPCAHGTGERLNVAAQRSATAIQRLTGAEKYQDYHDALLRLEHSAGLLRGACCRILGDRRDTPHPQSLEGS